MNGATDDRIDKGCGHRRFNNNSTDLSTCEKARVTTSDEYVIKAQEPKTMCSASPDQAGFNIEDIHTSITIWQGRLDKQALMSHAELYKRKLAHSTLYIFNDEAHISMLYNHIEKIIDSVKPQFAK